MVNDHRHENRLLLGNATGMSPNRDVDVITLTGRAGGGKSELLGAISEHEEPGPPVGVSEEAIHGMRFVRMSPRSPEFQCALVPIQAATEAALLRTLARTQVRAILTHRGTLDPCAFWQSSGNSRQSFFDMTGTTLEDHYRRYDLVIHLESAAVRVPEAYSRYPRAHRPEDIDQAARLDHLLGELWSEHPRYLKIEGAANVEEKLTKAMDIIRRALRLSGQSA